MELPEMSVDMPAIADPRWTARPLSLEELVLAYLRPSDDPAARTTRDTLRETE